MTVELHHNFTEANPDDPAAATAGKVLPSHWNDNHGITGGTNGAVLFESTGQIGESSNLNWDDTVQSLLVDATGTPDASVLSPSPGIIRIQRTGDPSPNPIQPWYEAYSEDHGGVWNRFHDVYNTATWQWGTSLVNGTGSGNAFWFFQESTRIDLGITPFALWTDTVNSLSWLGTNAKGVFGWNSDNTKAGNAGSQGGAAIDTALSRVSAGILAVGTTDVVGDFTGTIKSQAVQTVDASGFFATLHQLTSRAPVTQWTDTDSVSWQLGPFLASDNSFGFYNYQPSTNAGWTAFTDGSGANSKIWVAIGNDGVFGFGSAAGDPASLSVIDTGLSRISANTVGVGNGTQGNASGTICSDIAIVGGSALIANSPESKLNVFAGVLSTAGDGTILSGDIGTNAGDFNEQVIISNSGPTGSAMRLGFTDDSVSPGYSTSQVESHYLAPGGDLRLRVRDISDAYQERMVFLPDGTAAIGNTGPLSPTHVFSVNATGTSDALMLTTDQNGTNIIFQYSSGGTVDNWEIGAASAHSFIWFNSTNVTTPFAIIAAATGAGNQFQVNRDAIFNWTSDASYAGLGSADTGLSRIAANVVGVGNGTQGDFSGALKLTNLKVAPVAIASLPASPAAGDVACVNDGDASLTNGQTPVNSGAGATEYLVVYLNGGWRIVV